MINFSPGFGLFTGENLLIWRIYFQGLLFQGFKICNKSKTFVTFL